MKTIFDFSILDIAPKLLRTHPDFKIFLNVVDKLYKKYLVEQLKELVVLDRIEELEEWKVDLLAEEYHLDFYPLDSTLLEKKELVKNSIETHMKKGTTYAVKNTLNIFYKNANLIQWFENGKKAGTFDLEVSGSLLNNTEASRMLSAINAVKRESQHLNLIRFKFDSNTGVKVNSGLSFSAKQTINLLDDPGNYLLINDEYGLVRSAFTYSEKNKFIKIVPEAIYRIIDPLGAVSLEKTNSAGIPENGILKKIKGRLDFINSVSLPQIIEIIK